MNDKSNPDRFVEPFVASFVGTLPGPRTGMTLSTEQIVQRLRARGELRELDVGKHFRRHGVAWRLKKMCFSLPVGLSRLAHQRGIELQADTNSATQLLVDFIMGRIDSLPDVATTKTP